MATTKKATKAAPAKKTAAAKPAPAKAAPAKKTAAAKPAPAKAASTEKAKAPDHEVPAKAGDNPTVALPSGKGTQNDAPPASNPPPLERGTLDKNNPGIIKDDNAEDTIRRQKDKARWTYGETTPVAELMAEQRQIDDASKDE